MILDDTTGLYLPRKRRELWPKDDAKKFRALSTMLEARKATAGNRDVKLALICVPCNVALTPDRHEVTGEITLTCGCTVRVLEGLR